MIFNLDVVMKNTTVSLDSKYPEDATVTAGEDVTFKAVITEEGHPKEYSLQWYVDGTAVEDATGETYTRSTSSDKGVLSVWCEATNKAGTATSRHATLTVKKLPVLDASYPVNVNCTMNDTVAPAAVKIAESGYPDSYTYQWYANDAPVAGATGSTFNLSTSAVGTWNIYCIVTNSAGSVRSKVATITVNGRYLYNRGDNCAAITGGWSLKDTDQGPLNIEFTENNGSGTMIFLRSNAEAVGMACTNVPIDLSGYKTLNILMATTGFGPFRVGVMPTADRVNNYSVGKQYTDETDWHWLTLDITNVASGYIGFDTAEVREACYLAILEIYLS